jgi:polar amino acid transport system substrate-binding protein
MIQLLIIYYVVFQSVNISKILVAVIAFAINSGAYVAEIIRGGIMSIDEGQTEAGRSLGLNYRQTMIYIILPQAVKNVLPSLANEFITLIKETSICGYIGLMDLTRGGDIIRSQTYEPFLPLIAVALIYLVIVEILTVLVGRWEKSLRKSDR